MYLEKIRDRDVYVGSIFIDIRKELANMNNIQNSYIYKALSILKGLGARSVNIVDNNNLQKGMFDDDTSIGVIIHIPYLATKLPRHNDDNLFVYKNNNADDIMPNICKYVIQFEYSETHEDLFLITKIFDDGVLVGHYNKDEDTGIPYANEVLENEPFSSVSVNYILTDPIRDGYDGVFTPKQIKNEVTGEYEEIYVQNKYNKPIYWKKMMIWKLI